MMFESDTTREVCRKTAFFGKWLKNKSRGPAIASAMPIYGGCRDARRAASKPPFRNTAFPDRL